MLSGKRWGGPVARMMLRMGLYQREQRCFRGTGGEFDTGVYRTPFGWTVGRIVRAFEADAVHLLLVLLYGLFRERGVVEHVVRK